MTVQNASLRRWTIGSQLFAGVALLTASYFTTDQGWAQQVLESSPTPVQVSTEVAMEAFTKSC